MMDSSKYRVGYFPVEKQYNKWAESDSVLLGAVGGDKWNDVPGYMRPEKGLMRLRAGMGVYSNNRPAKIRKQLSDASPLKKIIVDEGMTRVGCKECGKIITKNLKKN